MSRISYTVPAIHCDYCAHTIKMELSDLEGVQSVQVDMNTRRVSIEYSPPATPEKIERLLAEINYPVQK